MTKAPFALAIVLLLGLPALASAGSLSWAPAGPYPTKSSCQPISFHEPDAIAVDRLGNIYIGNEDGSDAVQEVTTGARATIRTLLTRNIEGDYYGLSLAVGPEGRLYIAFKERGTIERLDADGTLTVIAGKPGERQLVDGPASKARLKAPNAIAIDRDGVIYVADTRTIRKIAPDGAITTLAGNPYAKNPRSTGGPYPVDGKGRRAVFMSPNGIAEDNRGDVYVADSFDGEEEGQQVDIGQIRKVTSHGYVSTVAGGILTTGWSDFNGVGRNAVFGGVYGIALAPGGVLYVTEPYGAPSIRKVSPNARVSTVVAEKTSSYLTTGLIMPTGIVFARPETIFVVDDVALMGLPSLTAKQIYWLHKIIIGHVETLCEAAGQH